MAINRGRLRNTGKAGDKADFRNTLDKYSLSEEETPNRERGIEVMMEKMEKMECGFEAMIKEIKRMFEKQVEEMKRKMKEERERSERERERERVKGKRRNYWAESEQSKRRIEQRERERKEGT